MISVVIPAYNYADYLPAAIDSVLAQGIDDLEILVCDDASTDNTAEVIARYEAAHSCVHGYRNLVNLGAGLNINYAASLAHGDYILVLGADDYLVPGVLAKLKETLDQHPECGYAYGRYNIETADGRILTLQHPGWLDRSYIGTRDEFAPLLSFDCYINIGATLFRRATVKMRESFFDLTLGTFEGERFFRATDWDLMLYLSLNEVRGAFLNEQISIFRQHPRQASGIDNYSASGVAVTEHMKLLDRYLTEETRLRCAGQLAQIFSLLYGKFLFYIEHANPAAPWIDEHIRRRFKVCCERFKQLLRRDQTSVMPPVLQAVLDAGQALHFSGAAQQAATGPMFSVVLTTFQRPALLQNALASVLEQTCQDFEILLVNDGGPLMESTLDWIGRDERVTYLRQPNRGPSGARNAALKLARGRYVVYLDDDDLMRANHLETLRDQLVLTPNAVVYTTAEYVTESLEGGRRIERKRYVPYAHEEYDKLRLQVCNYIPINTFCHARALLDHIGLFDESLLALEDWDLLIRLSRVAPFVHVQRNTVEVRQRLEDRGGHQTGRQFDNLHDLFRRLYERYDDLGEPAVRVGRAAVLAAEHPIQASLGSMSYQAWQDAHGLREVDAEILAERMVTKWHRRPLITLIMKVTRPWLEALGGTIQSLQQQLYGSWRLVVLADFPAPDPIFNRTDLLGWIQVENLSDVEVLAQALNTIVTDLPGDWIGLLPPGSELSPDCLLRLADYMQQDDKLSVVYSDHDSMLLPGCYADPQFKPDFNLEYLLNWDYIEAACWFNQQSVMSVGGFAAYPGKEGYELLLRLADQFGEASVGHLAYPLVHLPKQQETDLSRAAHRVAVSSHLARLGREAEVQEGAMQDTFKVAYPIAGTPLVSIIIPNRDKLEFLQPCIETLLAKTRYQQFEILVIDNQSVDPDVIDFYREIQASEPARVRVIEYDAPFNFSAQCNLGVSMAQGEYVLMLNNDIEIVQPEWLERMLMHAQRPEVGMVGAKLVYPETGMVQHGGIALGTGPLLLDVATHYGMECKLDEPGYMNRNQCEMYLSALTGACLLMRREVYTELGGMNEELSVLFNDVEFCLRTAQAGYKMLWTPYAVLVHHHGMSVNDKLKDPVEQGRFAERSKREHEYMLDNWLSVLARDPAYNRNLSLQSTPLSIEQAVPFTWDPSFNERPKILATAIPGGSGEYRVVEPLTALAVGGLAQVCTVRAIRNGNRMLKPMEIERMNPDVLVSQNGISDAHLETMRYYQKYFADKRRVVTLDDLLTDLPEKSSLYKQIKSNFRDARRRLRTCLSMADRLVVSTAPLAEFASEFIGDIQVVPNRLSKAKWENLATNRSVGRRPRVGWVGAQQHKGDLELIQEVVRATADEVDWVFMGMWPEGVDDCIREKRASVPFKDYPQAVASMNLDLAVAPLEINAFNESKSNLRLLEYGVLGWPVIASDIMPYQTNGAPVKRVPNTPEAWIEAIRERVHDLDATYREGDALRAWVKQHYMLEDHLEEWLRAYGK
ncbi:glycosyltransferase [Paludibacterium purpuratum]|uniref:GT2 family glycosyltransferase n=1 Tax=Paludibacterium purpuratum TaxID=1144873 RepID=A0A4V3DV12_9NEIS|nr:glycosyltransferase [Paludibacterium purpuratum]TDR78457.1 GT2 family glycosyltransferase [Paludibacterium purpuratum]